MENKKLEKIKWYKSPKIGVPAIIALILTMVTAIVTIVTTYWWN